MMIWLFGQAKANEEMYDKPKNSGQQIQGEEDREEDDSKYDAGFGKT